MCSVYGTVIDHDMSMEGVACILVLRIAGVPAPQGLELWWAASIRVLNAAHNVLCGHLMSLHQACSLIRGFFNSQVRFGRATLSAFGVGGVGGVG